MNDRWIHELGEAVGDAEPAPGFLDELRSDLIAEWGKPTTTPGHRRWWTAAASVALVAGLLAAFTLIDRNREPGPAERPMPATSTTLESTPPSSPIVGPATNEEELTTTTAEQAAPSPSTTASPMTTTTPEIEGLNCSTSTRIEAFATEFAEEMAVARDTGSLDLIADCIGATPAIYDGSPPNCWTTCPPASRTFHLEYLTGGQAFNPNTDDSFWTTRLPVTYVNDSAIVDVIETWAIRSSDGGFTIDDFRQETPVIQRQDATDIITEYLDHIANENWNAAADLITRAATAPFDERQDLQQIGASSYDQSDVADALARWCADGCDTTPPAPGELTFTGNFELTRNDQTIQAAWSEGTLGINGAPIR